MKIKDLETILAELIAIPSVNPMGRTPSPTTDYESRLTLHLEHIFRHLGIPFLKVPVHPDRENIVAWVRAEPTENDNRPVILWEAHQDTVPANGMTIDPWKPFVRDGRMFGRGACDVKGSLAAMLYALFRLAKEKPNRHATIVLACTVDEEAGGSGARALGANWHAPSTAPMPRKPDVAIVAEPTELDVVVAHKGVLRWRCHAHGRAVHSSAPDQGDNAIYRMNRVVRAFESYQSEVLSRSAAHPLLGRPTLSVGLIHGGTSVNVVPDRCTIEIDRRLLPGESGEQAFDDAIRFVAERAGGDNIRHESPYHISTGLSDRENGKLAQKLGDLARRFGQPGRPIGVPFGTDASHIAAAGVPTVVFGPGSIQQAHTADEWISLDQVHAASEILFQLACEL